MNNNLKSNIILQFIDIHTDIIHLTQTEWTQMIFNFIDKLNIKKTGSLIIQKLITHINNGYQIKISNKHNNSLLIYSKIIYDSPKSVLIIIPSVPYFTEVQTIKYNELYNDSELYNIANGYPTNNKYQLINSNIKIVSELISGFISFAHELIHCLRYFEGIILSCSLEEDNTIYGINSCVLSYNNIPITENSIRKEWGYNCRINHNSKPIFCYGYSNTYSNSINFTKKSFFI